MGLCAHSLAYAELRIFEVLSYPKPEKAAVFL